MQFFFMISICENENQTFFNVNEGIFTECGTPRGILCQTYIHEFDLSVILQVIL